MNPLQSISSAPKNQSFNLGWVTAALVLSLGSNSALAQTSKTLRSNSTQNWSTAVWSPSGAPDANTDIITSDDTDTNSLSLETTDRTVRDYSNTRIRNFQFYVGAAATTPTVTFTLRNVTTSTVSGTLTFRNNESSSTYGNLAVHITGDLTVNNTTNLGQTNTTSANTPNAAMNGSIHSFKVDGQTTIESGGVVNVFRQESVNATSAGSINLGFLNVNGGTLNLTGTGSSTTTENSINVKSLNGTATSLVRSSRANTFGHLMILGEGNGTYDGKIIESGGQVRLTKSGTGSQTLTGGNTYTGATSITGGSLILSGTGSINNTSGITITGGKLVSTSSVGLNRAVTINGGALRYSSAANYTGALTFTAGTLEGTNWNGNLGGQSIGAGKSISPGNSPGAASTTSQTWLAGGAYDWQIYDAEGNAGTGFDTINFSQTLDLTNLDADNRFTINVWSLASIGPDADGDALNFDASSTYSWLIASANEILIDGGSNLNDLFTINLSAVPGVTGGFTNANDAGGWTMTLGGANNNQLYLNYQSIPEPGVFSLLAGAGILGAVLRKRFKPL